jgi:hypothetical protein
MTGVYALGTDRISVATCSSARAFASSIPSVSLSQSIASLR